MNGLVKNDLIKIKKSAHTTLCCGLVFLFSILFILFVREEQTSEWGDFEGGLYLMIAAFTLIPIFFNIIAYFSKSKLLLIISWVFYALPIIFYLVIHMMLS